VLLALLSAECRLAQTKHGTSRKMMLWQVAVVSWRLQPGRRFARFTSTKEGVMKAFSRL